MILLLALVMLLMRAEPADIDHHTVMVEVILHQELLPYLMVLQEIPRGKFAKSAPGKMGNTDEIHLHLEIISKMDKDTKRLAKLFQKSILEESEFNEVMKDKLKSFSSKIIEKGKRQIELSEMSLNDERTEYENVKYLYNEMLTLGHIFADLKNIHNWNTKLKIKDNAVDNTLTKINKLIELVKLEISKISASNDADGFNQKAINSFREFNGIELSGYNKEKMLNNFFTYHPVFELYALMKSCTVFDHLTFKNDHQNPMTDPSFEVTGSRLRRILQAIVLKENALKNVLNADPSKMKISELSNILLALQRSGGVFRISDADTKEPAEIFSKNWFLGFKMLFLKQQRQMLEHYSNDFELQNLMNSRTEIVLDYFLYSKPPKKDSSSLEEYLNMKNELKTFFDILKLDGHFLIRPKVELRFPHEQEDWKIQSNDDNAKRETLQDLYESLREYDEIIGNQAIKIIDLWEVDMSKNTMSLALETLELAIEHAIKNYVTFYQYRADDRVKHSNDIESYLKETVYSLRAVASQIKTPIIRAIISKYKYTEFVHFSRIIFCRIEDLLDEVKWIELEVLSFIHDIPNEITEILKRLTLKAKVLQQVSKGAPTKENRISIMTNLFEISQEFLSVKEDIENLRDGNHLHVLKERLKIANENIFSAIDNFLENMCGKQVFKYLEDFHFWLYGFAGVDDTPFSDITAEFVTQNMVTIVKHVSDLKILLQDVLEHFLTEKYQDFPREVINLFMDRIFHWIKQLNTDFAKLFSLIDYLRSLSTSMKSLLRLNPGTHGKKKNDPKNQQSLENLIYECTNVLNMIDQMTRILDLQSSNNLEKIGAASDLNNKLQLFKINIEKELRSHEFLVTVKDNTPVLEIFNSHEWRKTRIRGDINNIVVELEKNKISLPDLLLYDFLLNFVEFVFYEETNDYNLGDFDFNHKQMETHGSKPNAKLQKILKKFNKEIEDKITKADDLLTKHFAKYFSVSEEFEERKAYFKALKKDFEAMNKIYVMAFRKDLSDTEFRSLGNNIMRLGIFNEKRDEIREIMYLKMRVLELEKNLNLFSYYERVYIELTQKYKLVEWHYTRHWIKHGRPDAYSVGALQVQVG